MDSGVQSSLSVSGVQWLAFSVHGLSWVVGTVLGLGRRSGIQLLVLALLQGPGSRLQGLCMFWYRVSVNLMQIPAHGICVLWQE